MKQRRAQRVGLTVGLTVLGGVLVLSSCGRAAPTGVGEPPRTVTVASGPRSGGRVTSGAGGDNRILPDSSEAHPVGVSDDTSLTGGERLTDGVGAGTVASTDGADNSVTAGEPGATELGTVLPSRSRSDNPTRAALRIHRVFADLFSTDPETAATRWAALAWPSFRNQAAEHARTQVTKWRNNSLGAGRVRIIPLAIRQTGHVPEGRGLEGLSGSNARRVGDGPIDGAASVGGVAAGASSGADSSAAASPAGGAGSLVGGAPVSGDSRIGASGVDASVVGDGSGTVEIAIWQLTIISLDAGWSRSIYTTTVYQLRSDPTTGAWLIADEREQQGPAPEPIQQVTVGGAQLETTLAGFEPVEPVLTVEPTSSGGGGNA